MTQDKSVTIRSQFLPFSRPSLGNEEIQEIIDSIQSGWITTGPKVEKFSEALKSFIGAPYMALVSSATAGLHLALLAHNVGAGDEVITTSLTFAATANVIELIGAKPVFVEIDPQTLQMRPEAVENALTKKTKAIVPVHFTGQPVDLEPLMALAKKKNIAIIEDAAHAIGTEYKGRKIGSHGNTTVFSFHPNKNMTTGEGGAVAVFDEKIYDFIALMRFHGMDKNAWKRFDKAGSARYDISMPGYKYNMMDIQAAMGLHQLKKLDGFIKSRTELAQRYNEHLRHLKGMQLPVEVSYPHRHAWHLYAPLVDIDVLKITRDEFMKELKDRNIGTGLHYTAVHEFSYYAKKYGYKPNDFPSTHYVSERILSLPLFPTMSIPDQDHVIDAVTDVCQRFQK